ncbi:hypothetical protein EVAR_87114_1 [Eumeta japonica]|uniref:Uncharacterized protein n=1 Tax=Eumeta variegata TaxID=151549 RepID=A0A4C2A1T1_EUMVA|nr:hypothetical protein EVAR_87114_1 [Eumeta japonica]
MACRVNRFTILSRLRRAGALSLSQRGNTHGGSVGVAVDDKYRFSTWPNSESSWSHDCPVGSVVSGPRCARAGSAAPRRGAGGAARRFLRRVSSDLLHRASRDRRASWRAGPPDEGGNEMSAVYVLPPVTPPVTPPWRILSV